jgi:hypothetical protein
MRLQTMIPAVAAPQRDGLDLAVTRLEGTTSERLLLEAGQGAAILELGPQEGFFVFSHGSARLRSIGDAAGGAFVEAAAEWVGLVALGDAEEQPAEAAMEAVTCSWVRLGAGEDGWGGSWDGFKLFLDLGERHAEIFLRVSKEGHRAQLLEKWSAYRVPLIEILERALVSGRPRPWGTPEASDNDSKTALSLGQQGAFDLEIPDGWRAEWRTEGHYRLTDADEEMMFEMSHIDLPPLPPDAPGVVERLRSVIESSDRRGSASPIEHYERDGIAIAWSGYTFMSHDTKRPEAPDRPARGRWLLATNAWVQVLVTGCWWEADREIAEPLWEQVVSSLSLRGRIARSPAARGSA